MKRIFIVLIVLLVTACSSIKSYEEIAEDVMQTRMFDEITYQYNFWAPIGVAYEPGSDKKIEKKAEEDQKLCIDEHRGVEFKDEILATIYLFQCMNKKGWYLETDQFFIVSH